MARPRKSRGVGDTVEKVTKATGVKKVVDTIAKVTGKDCGCNKRKEFLNRTFPYINQEKACMNQEQIEFYERFKKDYLSKKQSSVQIKGDDFKALIDLYNTVFQTNIKGCSGCQLNAYTDKLEKVYQNVKESIRA